MLFFLAGGASDLEPKGGAIFGRGLEVTLSPPKGTGASQLRIQNDGIDFELQVKNLSRYRLLVCRHPRYVGLSATGAQGSILDGDRYDPRGVVPSDWVVFAPGQTQAFVRRADVKKGVRGPVEVQGYVWVPALDEIRPFDRPTVRRLLKAQKARLQPGLFQTKGVRID